jgi:hypothetical protein
MKRRKKTVTPQRRNFDPAKATIYVAIITMLSAVTVAAFTNADKLWPHPQPSSQAADIITIQDSKKNAVMKALEERGEQALQQKAASPTPAGDAQVDAYMKSNAETRVMLEKSHGEFIDAVKRGDFFKANAMKTEINDNLVKDSSVYTRTFAGTGRFPNKEVCCYFQAPRRTMSFDSSVIGQDIFFLQSLDELDALQRLLSAKPSASPSTESVSPVPEVDGARKPRVGPEM